MTHLLSRYPKNNVKTISIYNLSRLFTMIIKRSSERKKKKARRYSTEAIIEADYTDNLERFLLTPAQDKSLLYGLEQAAKGIGLDVDSDKTEFMCFKQDDTVSTLDGKPLKFVDHFTYLNSNISFTKSDAKIHIGKA